MAVAAMAMPYGGDGDAVQARPRVGQADAKAHGEHGQGGGLHRHR